VTWGDRLMLIAALVSIGLISRSAEGGTEGGGGDGGGAGGGTVPIGGGTVDVSLDPPPQADKAKQIAKIDDKLLNFIGHLSA
jgi:hypothetical protein